MNASATLLSHLVADYTTQPTFVERTYGEPLFHTESEVLALRYAADDSPGPSRSRHSSPLEPGWPTARTRVSFDIEDVGRLTRALALASGTNEIALWNSAKASELARTKAESWVTAFAFSPDGKLLASGHDDGQIRL